MLHTSEIIHNDLEFPEFDFHSLRHTHTSMMLAAGTPIMYVQHRLGHKHPDVTLRVYQHMTEVVERSRQDVLGEFSKRRNKKEGRSEIRPSLFVLAFPNLSPVIQNLWDFVPSSE